jgi:hypothetical protein
MHTFALVRLSMHVCALKVFCTQYNDSPLRRIGHAQQCGALIATSCRLKCHSFIRQRYTSALK